MKVFAVDPGPEKCGVVQYEVCDITGTGRVVYTRSACTVGDVVADIRGMAPGQLVIERVQSYGIAGGSLLRTAETCGRLWQVGIERGHVVSLMYRREVLSALDITGRGNRDKLVRARCIEMHGGTRKAAQGTKAKPGALYGVSSHAWQALGLALAWLALNDSSIVRKG